MKKVAVDLLGPGEIVSGKHNYGLGNQLFQIAAALSYAKDNGFDAIFPCLRNKSKYGNYVENILRNLKVDEDLPANYKSYSNSGTKYTPIPVFENSLLIHGSYLQSEKYFSANRRLILDTFSPSEQIKNYLQQKYGEILSSQKTVSCHVRKGDYTELSEKYISLSLDYYTKALSQLKHEHVFVCSDDITWCRDNFKLNASVTFVEEEDYLELYLMSMCNDNIIANSTFSWWGAWLNQNENKKTIAPLSWFTEKFNKDRDIVPEDWILV